MTTLARQVTRDEVGNAGSPSSEGTGSSRISRRAGRDGATASVRPRPLGTRHRYDRKALDVHLDRLAGLDSSSEPNVNKADASPDSLPITRMLPGLHKIRRAKPNRVFEYWYAWRGGPQILAARASNPRSLHARLRARRRLRWKCTEPRSDRRNVR